MSRFSFNIEILALLTLRDSGVSYYMEAQGGSNWAPHQKCTSLCPIPILFYILKGLYMKSKNPEGEVPKLIFLECMALQKTYPMVTELGKSKLYKGKLCPSFV